MPLLKTSLAASESIRHRLSLPFALFYSAGLAAIVAIGSGLMLPSVTAEPWQMSRNPNTIVAQSEDVPTDTEENAPIGENVPTEEDAPTRTGTEIPDPQQFRSLEQADSSLSLLRAEELLAQSRSAIAAQNFDQAIGLLEEAFNAFNLRSNYYQELSKSFAGIDNRISDSLRNAARAAAQSRDETSFELAVVYRAAGRPEDAVAQLIQVISSQNPTRDLGQRAYNQLYELGFVETPYNPNGG
ncbi:MAG: hypothetical protein AB4040_19470 [Synechococcus sp.]